MVVTDNTLQTLSDTWTQHFEESLLGRLSKLLVLVIDYDASLKSAVQIAVPILADWCTVDLLDARGSLERKIAVHVNSTKESVLHELFLRYESKGILPNGLPTLVKKVIDTGNADFISDLTPATLNQISTPGEHRQLLTELGVKGIICVPLMARQRIFGAITLNLARATYPQSAFVLAQEFSRQLAIAADNAHTHALARDAVRSRENLFSFVARDLTKPINVLMKTSDFLLKVLPPDLPKTSLIRRESENIYNAAKTIETLIHNRIQEREQEIYPPIEH